MELGLKGLYDLHIHAGPDVRVRKLTSVELVQRAKQAGLNWDKQRTYPT